MSLQTSLNTRPVRQAKMICENIFYWCSVEVHWGLYTLLLDLCVDMREEERSFCPTTCKPSAWHLRSSFKIIRLLALAPISKLDAVDSKRYFWKLPRLQFDSFWKLYTLSKLREACILGCKDHGICIRKRAWEERCIIGEVVREYFQSGLQWFYGRVGCISFRKTQTVPRPNCKNMQWDDVKQKLFCNLHRS